MGFIDSASWIFCASRRNQQSAVGRTLGNDTLPAGCSDHRTWLSDWSGAGVAARAPHPRIESSWPPRRRVRWPPARPRLTAHAAHMRCAYTRLTGRIRRLHPPPFPPPPARPALCGWSADEALSASPAARAVAGHGVGAGRGWSQALRASTPEPPRARGPRQRAWRYRSAPATPTAPPPSPCPPARGAAAHSWQLAAHPRSPAAHRGRRGVARAKVAPGGRAGARS